MKRVLFVDDSRLIRRIGEAMLRDSYEVATASSVEEALKLAVRFHPDILLTDLNLGDGDGLELRDALAHDARTRHVPVVVVTTDCCAKMLESDVDVLLKPFDRESLVGKVSRCLQ